MSFRAIVKVENPHDFNHHPKIIFNKCIFCESEQLYNDAAHTFDCAKNHITWLKFENECNMVFQPDSCNQDPKCKWNINIILDETCNFDDFFLKNKVVCCCDEELCVEFHTEREYMWKQNKKTYACRDMVFTVGCGVQCEIVLMIPVEYIEHMDQILFDQNISSTSAKENQLATWINFNNTKTVDDFEIVNEN